MEEGEEAQKQGDVEAALLSAGSKDILSGGRVDLIRTGGAPVPLAAARHFGTNKRTIGNKFKAKP